ncbi:MAG: hypothetical protein ACREUM_00880, partial [Nitrosospira sp.]
MPSAQTDKYHEKPIVMTTAPPATGFFSAVGRWLDANIFALGREMRLSYLPPLMVYAAAGISGLTGIVGTFYV